MRSLEDVTRYFSQIVKFFKSMDMFIVVLSNEWSQPFFGCRNVKMEEISERNVGSYFSIDKA